MGEFPEDEFPKSGESTHVDEPVSPDTLVDLTIRMQKQPNQKFTLPTLRVVAGPNMLRFCSIYPNERIILGRDETCDMPLADTSVSRRHAAVTSTTDQQLTLQDLGSTNGTMLNERPVTDAITIQVGDQIEVGSITLRVDRMGLDELAHLARVVERLNLASKDSLTGLTTRHYLEQDLPMLVDKLREKNFDCAAVFLDVDHFKAVNDTFGHAIGDEVLRTVSRLLVMTVRDTDVCVRYGGEELLAILPKCDEDGGLLMARRVREALEQHDWTAHGVEGRSITASLGVAVLQAGETIPQWLTRADEAMYQAKKDGRNRVYSAGEIDRRA
jgi:two-component system, cell cycle response regulator